MYKYFSPEVNRVDQLRRKDILNPKISSDSDTPKYLGYQSSVTR